MEDSQKAPRKSSKDIEDLRKRLEELPPDNLTQVFGLEELADLRQLLKEIEKNSTVVKRTDPKGNSIITREIPNNQLQEIAKEIARTSRLRIPRDRWEDRILEFLEEVRNIFK